MNFTSSILLHILVILSLFSSNLSYSMERGYAYSGTYLDDRDLDHEDENGECIYFYGSDELCLSCFNIASYWSFSEKYAEDIDIKVIPPTKRSSCYGNECSSCYDEHPIFSGYLHFRYKGDYPFLKRQIEYSKRHPGYQTYWPETSSISEKISDEAVILFKDLIDSTALRKLITKPSLYNDFMVDSWYFTRLGPITLPRSLCVSCFRFSDFYQVCKDLLLFSEIHFTDPENIIIEEKIDRILDKLSGMFLDMYQESLSLHPTKEILEELEFIEYFYLPSKQFEEYKLIPRKSSTADHFLYNFLSFEADTDFDRELFPRDAESSQPLWFVASLLLTKGTAYNDFFLHKEAVESLTEAIKIDPWLIEAYQERAHAYFEMGKIELAILDYNKIKELEKKNPPYSLKESRGIITDVQYSTGFFVGLSEGGACSVADLPGSTYQCCSGITNGLWSFYWADNKREVAIEFAADVIATSYLLAEFIVTHTPQESAQLLVPELNDLIKNWDKLSEYRKGENVGYIIGKYGVDVLVPIAAFSGLQKFRKLKRANSLLTIERCALSQAERVAIIDTSATYSARSTVLHQSAKRGKVIARNPNVIPHVMDKKHAWDKLIKLSGDQAKDCEQVMMLLERNNIFRGKLAKKMTIPFEDPSSPLRNLRFEKTINGENVVAIFVENKEKLEIHLLDAWVAVK